MGHQKAPPVPATTRASAPLLTQAQETAAEGCMEDRQRKPGVGCSKGEVYTKNALNLGKSPIVTTSVTDVWGIRNKTCNYL